MYKKKNAIILLNLYLKNITISSTKQLYLYFFVLSVQRFLLELIFAVFFSKYIFISQLFLRIHFKLFFTLSKRHSACLVESLFRYEINHLYETITV